MALPSPFSLGPSPASERQPRDAISEMEAQLSKESRECWSQCFQHGNPRFALKGGLLIFAVARVRGERDYIPNRRSWTALLLLVMSVRKRSRRWSVIPFRSNSPGDGSLRRERLRWRGDRDRLGAGMGGTGRSTADPPLGQESSG